MKIKDIYYPYEPVEKKLIEEANFIKENTGMDVIFLRTEDGRLWHEMQFNYSTDKLKLVCDADGVIIMFSTDATLLNPVNCAVVEIDVADVPKGLDTSQEWVYREGVIERREYTKEEYIQKARDELIYKLSEIAAVITPLQDAVDLGISTEYEENKLNELKRYRVMLNRVEISEAPIIDWPESPL